VFFVENDITNMKKILFIVNAEWYFVLHWLPIAKELMKKGYKVYVATGVERTGLDEMVKSGVKVHCIPFKRGSYNLFNDLSCCISIIKTLVKVKPDIVHNITIKPIIWGTVAARLTKVPSIVNSVTGLGYTFIKRGVTGAILSGIIGTIYRYLFYPNNVYISFQNPDDKTLFINKRIGQNKNSFVIKGVGVDTKKFKKSSLPLANKKIIYAGRILWDKGFHEIVEAAKIVKARSNRISFIIAGTPDLKNPESVPEEYLISLHTQGLFSWVGHVNNMPELLKKAFVVILPSYREGLPTTLIEAAAIGRPIITTDAPGCREVVKNGVNGYLVPVKSHYELAEKILFLANNESIAQDMGKKSREIAVSQFDLKIILESYLRLYYNSSCR